MLICPQKPFNMPKQDAIDPNKRYGDESFDKLKEYYSFLNGRIREPHNPVNNGQNTHSIIITNWSNNSQFGN